MPATGGASKPKKLSKAQLMKELAEKTGLKKSEVEGVFDALHTIIRRELRSSAGEITALPGLLKIKKKDVPAKPARPGRNPATGETIMLKAKPASKGVKVTALKGLKEMV